MIDEHDHKRIRCPRIGGEVTFLFCRTENDLLPCKWIAGCWQGRIDIHRFIEENYSEEEKKRFSIPGTPKLASLVEMAEKAKK